ncbi:hypothetical protein AB834_06080 [PVC group bacterium (ex Bugula neritina AB1)]|nr:hypothetical protein AB834_06080 [PVC group bacterium (ex Bugula neritina AB1)]
MFQREETSKVEMLAVGSVALDDILSVAGSVERVMGGSCVHFSLAANLFFPVHLVGVVGDDYPQEHLDFLTDKGIGIGALEKKEGKSFYWRGRYVEDFSSVETLALDLGVFETFDPSLSGKYLSPKYLFLANIDPVLQMKILNQVERPHLVVMDTMNHWIEDSLRELWEVIKKVDVLILNDGEARLLSGQNDLLKAAEELITKGPKYLIIKRGENGSIFLDNEGNFFSIPAYPVKNVIDTTGAGDSFAGAFMGYVAFCDQISLEVFKKAMAYASCVASFTVQGFGVQGLANIEEKDILERFLEFKRMSTF